MMTEGPRRATTPLEAQVRPAGTCSAVTHTYESRWATRGRSNASILSSSAPDRDDSAGPAAAAGQSATGLVSAGQAAPARSTGATFSSVVLERGRAISRTAGLRPGRTPEMVLRRAPLGRTKIERHGIGRWQSICTTWITFNCVNKPTLSVGHAEPAEVSITTWPDAYFGCLAATRTMTRDALRRVCGERRAAAVNPDSFDFR